MARHPQPPPMAHVPDYHDQSNPFRSTCTVASSSRASFPNAGVYGSPRPSIPHSSHETASSAGHDRLPSAYPPSPETAYAPDNFPVYAGRPDKGAPSQYTSVNHDGNLGPRLQPKQQDNSTRDPEKEAGASSADMFLRQGMPPAGRSSSSSLTYGQDDDEDEGDILEDKALTILVCGGKPSVPVARTYLPAAPPLRLFLPPLHRHRVLDTPLSHPRPPTPTGPPLQLSPKLPRPAS